jgi:serine/threonine protein phosphatase PrpC
MAICPKCQTENRSGAKFCKNCAAKLPDTPAATRPLSAKETIRLSQADMQPDLVASRAGTKPILNPRTDTRPLPADPARSGFIRRPPGAIFGDAFLNKSLIFSDDQQHQYLVEQINTSRETQIHVCPNPSCGAIFLPRDGVPEKYCTDCGTVLGPSELSLVLVEKLSPVQSNVLQVIARGLSHGSVRAPLTAFEERVAGTRRYCLLEPQTIALEGRPESAQALKWGIELARGLDYLHNNGVAFGGRIDPSAFGIVNSRPVWMNFTGSGLHPEGYVSNRLPDMHALALLIFQWATGKTQFEHDPNLIPGVERVFEQALTGKGIDNGNALADGLEQALNEAFASVVVDHRLGWRTNVGMIRNLNEDSVLTLEIDRIQQSISKPLGLFVVADGMGGHAAGEVASGTIVNSIAQKASQDLMAIQISQGVDQDRGEWLRQAVETANKVVYEMRKSAGTDMGSTLVATVIEGNKAYIAHVGDSRAYLINSQGIQRLTTDHSLVERLIATNQITREEARHHPQRNVIYRTIGDKSKIDVEINAHPLAVGDFLLLCSDGLSGMVEDQTMQRIVLGAASPQAACDELIAAANAAGGDDNISVIIVEVVQN